RPASRGRGGGRGRRQSARALRQAARRRTHRCAAARRARNGAGVAVAGRCHDGRALAMRLLHLLVICALVFAAAYVYRVKMESTVRTEQVMKLRSDIRESRNAIAALRAEWAQLEAPGRLQGLAERHMTLKPLEATQ